LKQCQTKLRGGKLDNRQHYYDEYANTPLVSDPVSGKTGNPCQCDDYIESECIQEYSDSYGSFPKTNFNEPLISCILKNLVEKEMEKVNDRIMEVLQAGFEEQKGILKKYTSKTEMNSGDHMNCEERINYERTIATLNEQLQKRQVRYHYWKNANM